MLNLFVVMGAMKRNNGNMRRKRDIISKISMLIIISFVFLTISTCKNSLIVEGSYVIKEHQSLLLEEGETGAVKYIHDDIAYLLTRNSSQDFEDPYNLFLVDIQQPTHPIRLGRFDLAAKELLLDVKVEGNIAYLLRMKTYLGLGNWTITILDITEPENPIHLSSINENITHTAWDLWDFTIYNNYLYVCSDSSLEIFDCSNLTLPVKVATHVSFTGDIYINNEYMYLVSSRIKTYDLTDPINPILLGEVNCTKHTPAGSGVFGNYVIRAFWWSGLQAFNLTDPYHPTICGNYRFPQREIQPGGQIHNMEIQGDLLFAGGRKLYVFDISNPQQLERIAAKRIGDRDISSIALSGNYIFTNIHNAIVVWFYSETSLERNLGLGLGIGVGLPVVVGVSILIGKRKKKRE